MSDKEPVTDAEIIKAVRSGTHKLVRADHTFTPHMDSRLRMMMQAKEPATVSQPNTGCNNSSR